VTPEVGEHLDKARECLACARIILGAGVGEDAGRDAYLAAFHAAQALILARSGKVVKTHRGVHTDYSLNWRRTRRGCTNFRASSRRPII
jgi:uncharacterized protein (UPF0332 family)